MSFEETEDEIYQDVASLNMDLHGLITKKEIRFEHVLFERNDIHDKGEFNLEGLFVRLELAIDAIHAKRVVMDSIESLFAGITDAGILRLEIKRLFRWLKQKQVTAVITGELGQNTFTRHGLEEFISDCIILLDNRVRQQVSTRRIRVIKYRGSDHGTNEYPFVIDKNGLSVIPILRQDSIIQAPKRKCQPALRPWISCLRVGVTPKAAPYSFQAPQARVKPALRQLSQTKAANAANAVFICLTKNRLGNLFRI